MPRHPFTVSLTAPVAVPIAVLLAVACAALVRLGGVACASAPDFIVFAPIAHGQSRLTLQLALSPDGVYTGPGEADTLRTAGVDAALGYAYAFNRRVEIGATLPAHGLIADPAPYAQALRLDGLDSFLDWRTGEVNGRQGHLRVETSLSRGRTPRFSAGASIAAIRDPISLSLSVRADDLGPHGRYTLTAGVDLLVNDTYALGADAAWSLPRTGLDTLSGDLTLRWDPGRGPFWSLSGGIGVTGGRAAPRIGFTQGWRF